MTAANEPAPVAAASAGDGGTASDPVPPPGSEASICTVCPDKPGHGWKESGVTHCHTCHTTWARGNKYMHCVTCHETFSTPANCDRHQVGTKADPGWRCRPPESVGLIASERSIGSHGLTVWHMPGTDDLVRAS